MEVDDMPQDSSIPSSRLPTKRSAEDEAPREQKRLRRAVATLRRKYHSDDGGDLESDADSQYSLHDSTNSEQSPSTHTPATLHSQTGSHRYPSELKTIPCPHADCDKTFNRPARLKDHLRSHTNDRVFKCPHDGCDKDFLRDSHLNHHIKSAHSGTRDYVCEWEDCGKAFVTATRLRRHAAVHEGGEKHRCTKYPPCNETFRKHATLQRHVTSVHLHQKPFPCTYMDPATEEQCSERFDTAGNLRAHVGRVHGGSRFYCAECLEPSAEDTQATSYSTYANLQAHIRTAHSPTCSHCSLTCSTPRELRRHVELAHGGLNLSERKVHPCSYPDCGQTFTKKGNLNVHVRTVHGGERRFVCGETDLSASKKVEGWTGEGACGSRFGAKLSLEEHVRTAHFALGKPRKEKKKKEKRSEESSLLTSLTGAGYAAESGRHIPCLVEGCAFMFHRNYDLTNHLKSSHGISEMEIQGFFAGSDVDPINHGGILWTEYDRTMCVGDEDDATVQLELDRQYDEMMQLDLEDGHGAEEGLRDAFQMTEDTSDAVVDPVLRYLRF